MGAVAESGIGDSGDEAPAISEADVDKAPSSVPGMMSHTS